MRHWYPDAHCQFRFVEVHYAGCDAKVEEGAWVAVFYDHRTNTQAETYAANYREMLRTKADVFLTEYLQDYNTGNMGTAASVGLGAGSVRVDAEMAPLLGDGVVIGQNR